MARTPGTGSPRIPTLGAGWYFPVMQLNSGKTPLPMAMAMDEISVRQSIEIILSTRKGERTMRPDFGCDLDKLLFLPNNGTTQALAAFEVEEALRAWEPRIEVQGVEVRAGGASGELLLIDIDYRVRSTDNRFSLVYPFYLDRAVA